MNNNIDLTGMEYAEKHRPQLHFSPAKNWMNDPNGMVYYDGVYHLFYQYNPDGNVWNDMHWGHATSTDLIHWEHKPVALYSEPKGLGYIFSGCAVVDWNNTSRLGEDSTPPLIAIFTHSSKSNNQVQSIAYSNDLGDTWKKYKNNPVLSNQGIADFRDPKVFWDERSQDWIMVLAADKVIKFYRSKDLINWSFFHDFGQDIFVDDGVWECPDLFQLQVNGTQEKKWVLLVSLNPGGPNGGSGTRYCIGDFDGDGFHAEHTEDLWLDYGPDNYAGVTWSDVPKVDGRRILMAWMSNWAYANHTPTDPWRGAMTLPRELSLIQTSFGTRLAAPPIREFESLRHGATICLQNLTLNEPMPLIQEETGITDLFDMEINYGGPKIAGGDFRIRLFNNYDEQLIIDVRASINLIHLNRERASFGMNEEYNFFSESNAPLLVGETGQKSIRLIKDASSIELLSGEGFGIFTARYFVDSSLNQIEIMPLDCVSVALQKVELYELRSIWNQKQQTAVNLINPTKKDPLDLRLKIFKYQ